jgi:hypothetical protein
MQVCAAFGGDGLGVGCTHSGECGLHGCMDLSGVNRRGGCEQEGGCGSSKHLRMVQAVVR